MQNEQSPWDEPTQQIPSVGNDPQAEPTLQFLFEPTRPIVPEPVDRAIPEPVGRTIPEPVEGSTAAFDATQEIPAVEQTLQFPVTEPTQPVHFGVPSAQGPVDFAVPGAAAAAAAGAAAASASQQATTNQPHPAPLSVGQWSGASTPATDAWGAPVGQPVVPAGAGQPIAFRQPPRSSAGRKVGAAAALVGVLGTAFLVQGPLQDLAGVQLPGTSQTQPAQQPNTGSQPNTGTQPNTGSQPNSGTQPGQQDPAGQGGPGQWPGQGSEDNQGSGNQGSQDQGTNEQAGTTTQGQTNATAAQQTGVVLIDTKTTNGQAAGTGMVLTTNGYVLTNYHVVQSSTSVEVTIPATDATYKATVVGHDASNDVALLKLENASGLATVTIDKDNNLAVGSTVTAVGNSNGQGFLSAAAGQVTDLSSSITVTNENSASGTESLQNVYQTSAQAVPGDSGGPLVDSQGEVVGMTTAGQSTGGGRRTQSVTVASFAVPITRALGIVDQIEAGNESGTVRIGPNAYLGVSVQTDRSGQLVVSSVVQGQAAAKAGLTAGDVITGLGDATISTHAELSAAISTHEPGDQVSITWTDQNGQQHRGTVTLGESPVN